MNSRSAAGMSNGVSRNTTISPRSSIWCASAWSGRPNVSSTACMVSSVASSAIVELRAAESLSCSLPLLLLIAAGVLGAGLMIYSQTVAFTGDEGFHLLAAQLIDSGKRPYIDFCFPQTPLNAYWNAG